MAEFKCSVCAPFVVAAVAVVSGINMVVTLGSYNSPKPSKLRNFLQHFNDNINCNYLKIENSNQTTQKITLYLSVCYVSILIPALSKCVC